MTPKRRRRVTPEVADDIWRLAEQRTYRLLKEWWNFPPADIAANAYIQGLLDARESASFFQGPIR